MTMLPPLRARAASPAAFGAPLAVDATSATGRVAGRSSVTITGPSASLGGGAPADASALHAAVVEATTAHFARSALFTQGLATHYSARNPITTTEHKLRQARMLGACARGDFATIASMVAHADPAKRTSAERLAATLTPLLGPMTAADYHVLAVVVLVHDLGKVNRDWAQRARLDLVGSNYIAHDFESERLLRANPQLLEGAGLSSADVRFVETLSKLHTMPGQYAHGETHLGGYDELCSLPGYPRERALRLACVHGVIDVLSSLNEQFDVAQLDSYVALRETMAAALASDQTMGERFALDAARDTAPALREVGAKYGLGDVAIDRLARIIKPRPALTAEQLGAALERLDPSFVRAFAQDTESANGWYGVCVSGCCGSGLVRQLAAGASGAAHDDAVAAGVRAVVKATALASGYRRALASEPVRGPFSLSMVSAASFVGSGAEAARAFVNELDRLPNLDTGLRAIARGESSLRLRGSDYAVALEWCAEPLAPAYERAAAAAQRGELRAYHLLDHALVRGGGDGTHELHAAQAAHLVALDLAANFARYGLTTLGSASPALGSPHATDAPRVELRRRRERERVEAAAQRYALDTGITLDASLANLQWAQPQGSWHERGPGTYVLRDTAPRWGAKHGPQQP